MEKTTYDVAIIGGGVSGTALLYTLSRFTNIKRIALIEKYSDLATVNSKSTHNSQTLHFGDIETNYTVQKASSVKKNTDMVRRYVEEKEKEYSKKIYSKYNKMVLAVGDEQVSFLEKRYEDFKELFPNLKKIGKEEIGKLEPNIIKGRDEKQNLLALSTEDGYTMDFGELAKSFAHFAKGSENTIDFLFEHQVQTIKRNDEKNLFTIKTDKEDINARFVVTAAGGHSLLLAHRMGYGKEFSILSVAGSFFWAPRSLNGKVYTIQVDKLPFAAIHGDPDVHDQNETRFGPTAKAIPLLERYTWSSFPEYFETFGLRLAPILSIFNILWDRVIFTYIAKNFLYDIPLLGRYLFLKEVKKIVPTITFKDLRYAKGMGGTRPQIVNTIKKSLDMGEAKIKEKGLIFNITPSPGASTCLGNAYNDAQSIVDYFQGEFTFDKKAFDEKYVD